MYQVMMYRCDEESLGNGGVQKMSLADAKELVAAQRARDAAKKGAPNPKQKPKAQPKAERPKGGTASSGPSGKGGATPAARKVRKLFGG